MPKYPCSIPRQWGDDRTAVLKMVTESKSIEVLNVYLFLNYP